MVTFCDPHWDASDHDYCEVLKAPPWTAINRLCSVCQDLKYFGGREILANEDKEGVSEDQDRLTPCERCWLYDCDCDGAGEYFD